MAIEVFQNLDISCEPSIIGGFITALTQLLDDGWTRDMDLEGKVNNDFHSYKHYCFQCNEKVGRSASTLWLIESESGLRVNNIVPVRLDTLSFSEYNGILNEFYIKYIQPLSGVVLFTSNLSKPLVTIEDWAKAATVAALKRFSGAANKSSGRSHPLDDERWMNFVIVAHEENDPLDSEELRRWLMLEEKWFDEIAWDLSADYEYGRNLLKKFGSNQ